MRRVEDAEEDLDDWDRLNWAYIRPPGNTKTTCLDNGRKRDRPQLLHCDHLASWGRSCVMVCTGRSMLGKVACRVGERPQEGTSCAEAEDADRRSSC